MQIKVKNPMKMNEWDLPSLSLLMFSWTLTTLTLIGLNTYEIEIPFVHQIVVGSYIILTPGYLSLHCLRIKELDTGKTILLAVGLGASVLMGVGYILNHLFFSLGWSNPFTGLNIALAIVALNIVLSTIAWIRKVNDQMTAPLIDLSILFSIPFLLLLILPLFAIVATYALNRTGDNVLQILLLFAIGLCITLACFKKIITPELYPLAILSLSLALLWHSSLVSDHVVEWADASFEYWSSNRVIMSGGWESDLNDRTANLLSLSMLVPMIALPSNIGLTQFFKMVFPLLFSFVPLGVYYIARGKMSSNLALTTAFIVISFSTFYTEMLGLNRQMIAELFMVLVIIILYDSNFSPRLKLLLLVIFITSLAVSHYGLLMIFVICMTLSLVFLFIISLALKIKPVNLKLIAVISVGMLFFLGLWFTDTSEYHLAHSMLNTLKEIINEFFNFQTHESSIFSNIVDFNGLPLNVVFNTIVILVLLSLIVISLIDQLVMIKREKPNFDSEYIALAVTFVFVMVSGAYNANILLYVSETRLIHITLLVLAPLLPLGACVLTKKMRRLRPTIGSKDPKKIALICMTSLIILIFTTNTGFISAIAGQDLPYELEPTDRRPSFVENEVNAAEWAAHMIGTDTLIKADAHRTYLMVMYTGTYSPLYTENGHDIYPVLPHKTFYYYGRENVDGMIWLDDLKNPRMNDTLVPIPSGHSEYMFSQNMVYNAQLSIYYYDNSD